MPGAPRTNPSASRGAQADLAARLQQTATGLEDRLNRRDTLIELIRSGNGTLDPSEVGDALLSQTAEWFPADCLVVAIQDGSPEPLVADLKVGTTKAPGYVVPTFRSAKEFT